MYIAVIIILSIFAVYGFISLIGKYMSKSVKITNDETDRPYMVMTVKNRQDDIEGIVRMVAWQISSERCSAARELIIVDSGSEDDTFEILSRLETEYDFIHIMTKERYIDMLNGISGPS